jgi:dephospho-CoA kinase
MIAITGGPATGKSVVLRFLNEQGLKTESADDVVRELWQNPEIVEQVRELLDLPAAASREDVRTRILNDPDARRSLNALFHAPVVRRLFDAKPDAVEIPLLVETVVHPEFDEVWVLVCGRAIQSQRLMARGLNESAANQLIDAHLPDAVKAGFATAIVRTDGPLNSVYERVLELLSARS